MSTKENVVRGRGFPELRNKKLKEQAVAFYSEHKVQDALEKLLNEMFLAEPRDVYGYMVCLIDSTVCKYSESSCGNLFSDRDSMLACTCINLCIKVGRGCG